MGISSKQVTMVTAQGEEWLHELCRIKLWLQILSWKPPSTNSHTNEDTNIYKNKRIHISFHVLPLSFSYPLQCYHCQEHHPSHWTPAPANAWSAWSHDLPVARQPEPPGWLSNLVALLGGRGMWGSAAFPCWCWWQTSLGGRKTGDRGQSEMDHPGREKGCTLHQWVIDLLVMQGLGPQARNGCVQFYTI